MSSCPAVRRILITRRRCRPAPVGRSPSCWQTKESEWTLTPAGRLAAVVPPAVRTNMGCFSQNVAGLRGQDLVVEAYRRHPDYRHV